MPDWNKKFKAEYDYARTFIGNSQMYDADWQALIRKLQQVMGDSGFEASKADALDDLRAKIDKATQADGEHFAILQAVGLAGAKSSDNIDSKVLMRAAALKMLRHVYLAQRSGSRKVWIHSLPKRFQDWASDDLFARGKTVGAARTLLSAQREQFGSGARRHLRYATFTGLAWCQKTLIVLSDAASTRASKAAKRATARAIVERWFRDPAMSDADLDTIIADLKTGFKKVVATLNNGQLILTDWVPLRGATVAAEVSWLNAEAFTFRNKGEGLDVVYIENSFFGTGDVVKGSNNWVRVVIHELTHLSAGTEDVVKGQARYAWYGIGPHAGFTGAEAARNADSWAFFALDCAGQLTDSERNLALTII